MSKEINLKIVLKNPVNGTVYGLQKGKGSNYATIQAQLGNDQELSFEFIVQVKQTKGSAFSLSGPFVQGTAESRLVYINIGSYAGHNAAQWSGRLKVPLNEATLCNTQANIVENLWYCMVPGSIKDGKPMFATVKSFAGWFMQERSL